MSRLPDNRVASPCIRECCLDEHNVCLGCHRSLREICDWSDATDAERLDILTRCAQRREERENRRETIFPCNE
jgi:predicted Fe-S protein YdhL (DUF1289 family)